MWTRARKSAQTKNANAHWNYNYEYILIERKYATQKIGHGAHTCTRFWLLSSRRCLYFFFLSLFLSFLFEKWTGWNNNFYWNAHSHITCVCSIYRVLFFYVNAYMYRVSHYLAFGISQTHIMMPTVWFATWFFQLRFDSFSFCILSPRFPIQPLASSHSVCRFCALFSSNLLIFALNELFSYIYFQHVMFWFLCSIQCLSKNIEDKSMDEFVMW